MLDSLSYLTADIPGIGGVIKQRPEDFVVEEQPLYEPVGSGEHLYVFIEKRGLTTTEVVRRLARAYAVSKSAIGFAGMKDKQALTRQYFSIHLPGQRDDGPALERLDHAGMKVLLSARHANKLRRGHLAGNRFVIYIRQVEPARVLAARQVLDRLAALGAPNYVGPQRFGYRGNNDQLGRLLLQGRWQDLLDTMLGQPRDSDFPATRAGREAYERRDYAAALEVWPRHLHHERQPLDLLRQGRCAQEAVMHIDATQRDFLVSAAQSAVFNQVLHQRLGQGTCQRLVPGDLAWKHDNRAVFAVDDATAALENAPDGRMQRLHISPSGPLWGVDMTRPAGDVLASEEQALQADGLTLEDLANSRLGRVTGARRSLREPLREPDLSSGVDEHGPFIRLAFMLGRGAFATAVLREVMKTNAAGDADGLEE